MAARKVGRYRLSQAHDELAARKMSLGIVLDPEPQHSAGLGSLPEEENLLEDLEPQLPPEGALQETFFGGELPIEVIPGMVIDFGAAPHEPQSCWIQPDGPLPDQRELHKLSRVLSGRQLASQPRLSSPRSVNYTAMSLV